MGLRGTTGVLCEVCTQQGSQDTSAASVSQGCAPALCSLLLSCCARGSPDTHSSSCQGIVLLSGFSQSLSFLFTLFLFYTSPGQTFSFVFLLPLMCAGNVLGCGGSSAMAFEFMAVLRCPQKHLHTDVCAVSGRQE